MSAHDKRVALLRLAYEAFNRRDVDAVLQGNLLSESHVAHAYTFRGERIHAMEVYSSVDDAKR